MIYPEDVPPRRNLRPRHDRKSLICRIEDRRAADHELPYSQIPFVFHRALCKPCGFPWPIINECEKAVRQCVSLPFALPTLVTAVVVQHRFNVGEPVWN